MAHPPGRSRTRPGTRGTARPSRPAARCPPRRRPDGGRSGSRRCRRRARRAGSDCPAATGAMLVFSRSISDATTFGGLVEALDAGQERRHQIAAREVVRRLHAGAAEEDLEQLGQRRVGHVARERRVLGRRRRVEEVLVAQADDDFVDERRAEARDLRARTRPVAAAARRGRRARRDGCSAPIRCSSGPAPRRALGRRSASSAAGVPAGHAVALGAGPLLTGPTPRLAVVQPPMIGWLADGTRQAIGTSSTNDVTFLSARSSASAFSGPSGLVTFTRSNVSPRLTTNGSLRWPTNIRPLSQPGIEDVVDVIVRVGRVVRDRLAADVVDRLAEHDRAVGCVRDGLACCRCGDRRG